MKGTISRKDGDILGFVLFCFLFFMYVKGSDTFERLPFFFLTVLKSVIITKFKKLKGRKVIF